MSRKRLVSVQVQEGRWYALGAFDHDECCDCSLIHKTEYRLDKGRLFFRTWRDDAATKRARRALGITVTRES